ncbi:MAG: hypothetical protein C0596_02875 [Marinilabiliales bacterium]|nr:MAG: hypothetical protein C0596_02875 [Marinilabiliales bacterium]
MFYYFLSRIKLQYSNTPVAKLLYLDVPRVPANVLKDFRKIFGALVSIRCSRRAESFSKAFTTFLEISFSCAVLKPAF